MHFLTTINYSKVFALVPVLCQAITYTSAHTEASDYQETLKVIDENLALCYQVNIREATIDDLQAALTQSLLTSAQLTECYLNRIRHMDPYLKSVIETNPDAMDIAEQLDQERTNGNLRGPLHGIPILIKDNIATNDKMNTTAGAEPMLLVRAKDDASVVKKLRAAGAVILGKNNLSEWVGFRDWEMPEGASTRGGKPRNPYSSQVETSGSSSGSAVSVAASLAAASIATETDNSLIGPSSLNSCAGIKPTVKLTSSEGVIKLTDTQDSVGVIARTVQDMKIVLESIIDEPIIESRPSHWPTESLEWILSSRTLRVGIPRVQYWADDAIAQQISKLNITLEKLKERGVEIVENLNIAGLDQINEIKESIATREVHMILFDFKRELNDYLQKYTEPAANAQVQIKSLADVLQYNSVHPSIEKWQQRLIFHSNATKQEKKATYIRYRDENIQFAREGLNELFKLQHIDALAVPSHPYIDSARFPAVAGYPIATVPVGYLEDNTPFGISFFGPPLSESKLLALAEKVESSIKARKVPDYT